MRNRVISSLRAANFVVQPTALTLLEVAATPDEGLRYRLLDAMAELSARIRDGFGVRVGPAQGGRQREKARRGLQGSDHRVWRSLAWFQPDTAHSESEVRHLPLGRSSLNRLLAVHFTDRGDELIRIISARLATPRERRKYELKVCPDWPLASPDRSHCHSLWRPA